eukprot:2123162-Rhodomonas_salina.1
MIVRRAWAWAIWSREKGHTQRIWADLCCENDLQVQVQSEGNGYHLQTLLTNSALWSNAGAWQEVFEREVEIMRLAAHPSCVSLKESIATSRYLYIVMELLGIFPHASNAMISTDLLCADAPEGGELCERISSRSHYSETESIVLRARYAKSGTDIEDAATRLPSASYNSCRWLPRYRLRMR